MFCWSQGDSTLAQQRFEESLAQWREIGHKESLSSILKILGELAIEKEDYTQARIYLEESLVIEQKNNISLRARVALLQCDGVVACDAGGIPTVTGCEDEQTTFRACLNG